MRIVLQFAMDVYSRVDARKVDLTNFKNQTPFWPKIVLLLTFENWAEGPTSEHNPKICVQGVKLYTTTRFLTYKRWKSVMYRF